MQLDALVRGLRGRFELPLHVDADGAHAACEATALDLVGLIIQRSVYSLLLPQLSAAREGALAPLLRRANDFAKICAATARPPWRLPLLQGLLGTFVFALDEALASKQRFFGTIVTQAPVHLLKPQQRSLATPGVDPMDGSFPMQDQIGNGAEQMRTALGDLRQAS